MIGYGSPQTLTSTDVNLAKGLEGYAPWLKPTFRIFAPAVLDNIYSEVKDKVAKMGGASAAGVSMLEAWAVALPGTGSCTRSCDAYNRRLGAVVGRDPEVRPILSQLPGQSRRWHHRDDGSLLRRSCAGQHTETRHLRPLARLAREWLHKC